MREFAFRQRTLSAALLRASGQFPVTVVTGPRQSGKTTLVQNLFGMTHSYCSLDDPTVRQTALSDPRLLLARFPPPVILDEIQYAPELLHYVKSDVDRHRSHRGRYVVTGSQAFPLMERVSESLAGRAAVFSLLSMSLAEIRGEPAPEQSWRDALRNARSTRRPVTWDPIELAGRLLRGGYPEPALDSGIDARLWHSSYIQTYLERDVRSLRAVGDLADFQRFLFALSARAGGLINFADLSRDLGISGKTVKAWISVLEASGQIVTLKPYHASLGKRLVKRPKVYLLDTGTLAYLLGLDRSEQALEGMAAGPLFESAVLAQIYRLLVHRGEMPRVYFWRTAGGHEVDFLIDAGDKLIPVEAKLTSSPTPQQAEGIVRFLELFGKKAGPGLLVCLCQEPFPLARGVDAIPLGAL